MMLHRAIYFHFRFMMSEISGAYSYRNDKGLFAQVGDVWQHARRQARIGF
jgi:hypothetical protein